MNKSMFIRLYHYNHRRKVIMATLKDLQAQIDELKAMVLAQGAQIEELKSQSSGGRDRGPKSEGEMTEEHAVRVMLGDLRDKSHKEAALELKLSYGQIYSARKGYTFKKIYQRMIKGETIDIPLVESDIEGGIDPHVLAAQAVDALEEIQQWEEA